jgi:hypothetical protein
MNSTTKNRTLGATALLTVLLVSAACGNDTVSETDPGNQPAANPAIASPYAPRGTSADRAEREAAEEKARQDQASSDRWARGTNVENKLEHAGHPGRP